jgi:nicotinamide-nucleotide amidase
MNNKYKDIFSYNDMIKLQMLLKQNNQTITAAESCTGGLIASMITEVSGSSSIFKGSVVTYCNQIKEQELGVKKDTMMEHGVVSCEVVDEMLEGVMKKFSSNYAIAVSGVAGPLGGTANKPVGTVVIGICDDKGYKKSEIFYFSGDRKEVQNKASKTAFKLIFEILLKNT